MKVRGRKKARKKVRIINNDFVIKLKQKETNYFHHQHYITGVCILDPLIFGDTGI
jgi:hypothetical protein